MFDTFLLSTTNNSNNSMDLLETFRRSQNPPTYGWVYIAPPQQQKHQHFADAACRTSQPQRGSRYSGSGLLGPAPRAYTNQPNNQVFVVAKPGSNTENAGWIMDTGATDHVHASEGTLKEQICMLMHPRW